MTRSLLPREHGAYFQLGIPLGAIAFRTGSTFAAAALTLAAVFAFLAHEPLSIALGGRGPRLRSTEGRRARLRFVVLAVPALAAGTVGLATAPIVTSLIAATVGLVGIGVAVLAARRIVHSVSGELVAVVALTGASAVAAAAAGLPLHSVLEHWAAWAIGFGATTCAVHRVLARRPSTKLAPVEPPPLDSFSLVFVLGAIAVIALIPFVTASLIAVPLVAAAAAIVIVAPSAKRVRAVGVVIATVAFAAAALEAVVF